MKRLRKGDQVEVICGRDKGRRGSISTMLGDRALVDGVNVVKRHTKPNPYTNTPGGVVDKVKPIHTSNLMLINPQSNKPERVSVKLSDGSDSAKKQRYFKSNSAVI